MIDVLEKKDLEGIKNTLDILIASTNKISKELSTTKEQVTTQQKEMNENILNIKKRISDIEAGKSSNNGKDEKVCRIHLLFNIGIYFPKFVYFWVLLSIKMGLYMSIITCISLA